MTPQQVQAWIDDQRSSSDVARAVLRAIADGTCAAPIKCARLALTMEGSEPVRFARAISKPRSRKGGSREEA